VTRSKNSATVAAALLAVFFAMASSTRGPGADQRNEAGSRSQIGNVACPD
jgi:hypothetical protein